MPVGRNGSMYYRPLLRRAATACSSCGMQAVDCDCCLRGYVAAHAAEHNAAVRRGCDALLRRLRRNRVLFGMFVYSAICWLLGFAMGVAL